MSMANQRISVFCFTRHRDYDRPAIPVSVLGFEIESLT